MKLDDLSYFLTLAEKLNFSRAAAALFISQPTLSVHIQSLEKELGVKLFHRTHQRVLLTPVGAELLPIAREIVDLIRCIPEKICNADAANETDSKLIIGFDQTDDRVNQIQSLISEFQRSHPAIPVHFRRIEFNQIEKALLESQMDIAIAVTVESDTLNPEILSYPLVREPLVIAAANTHNASLTELLHSRELLCFRYAGSERWQQVHKKQVEKLSRIAKISYTTISDELNINLLTGNSLAIVPLTYARSLGYENITVYPYLSEEFGTIFVTLSILWNKYRMNPMIQRFLDEARRQFTTPNAWENSENRCNGEEFLFQ